MAIYLSLRLHDIHHKNNKEKPLNMYTSPSNIQGMRESEKNEKGLVILMVIKSAGDFSVVHLAYSIGNIIPGELSMNGLESLQPQQCGFFWGKTNQKIVFGYFSVSVLYPLVF